MTTTSKRQSALSKTYRTEPRWWTLCEKDCRWWHKVEKHGSPARPYWTVILGWAIAPQHCLVP